MHAMTVDTEGRARDKTIARGECDGDIITITKPSMHQSLFHLRANHQDSLNQLIFSLFFYRSYSSLSLLCIIIICLLIRDFLLIQNFL